MSLSVTGTEVELIVTPELEVTVSWQIEEESETVAALA
jgi:hypothetical protein